MTVLLLEPHHDDAVLFASYQILLHRPIVITVLGNATYQLRFGISREQRSKENGQALWWLGDPLWIELQEPDENPNWKWVEQYLRIFDDAKKPEIVLAPMYEIGGHEHHNALAICAQEVFARRFRGYATYRRGFTRTQTDFEVPYEPSWPARKFRAMACFESQINLPNTRPWFSDWSREWMA